MKTLPAIILCFASAIALKAQPVTDMQPQQDYFYGTDGNTIHQYTLTGGSVTDQGPCAAPYSSNLYSLSFGNDILNSSTNRTLYASAITGGMGEILRWSGTAWDVVYSDNYFYLNGGAYGNFIYFMRYDFSTTPNTQSIVRLMSDGTLQTVFQDNSLEYTVADLAVDNNGYIYCFRGTGVGNTNQMNVISPLGVIVGTYATTLNYQQGFYGSMFKDGTLYLGMDVGTPALLPVNFSGTTASLGMPVFNNNTLTDLANAHGLVAPTALPDFNSNNELSVNLQGDQLVIKNNLGTQVTALVFDQSGKLVVKKQLTGTYTEMDVQYFTKGVYVVQVIDGAQKVINKRFYKG